MKISRKGRFSNRLLIASMLFLCTLGISACGGGSSSSDGGGGADGGAGGGNGEATIPQDISGTYSGTWEGSGTNAAGTFTCTGTFTMTISQSGTTLVVNTSINSTGGTGAGQCTEPFNFAGNGTYTSNNGQISIISVQGTVTASLNGTASQQNETITLSGNWSTTNSSSAVVIASGTWTGESQ